MGMQKYMFVDLFIHGATVSRVSAVGQEEWEALGGWGFSSPPSWFPLWKVICDMFSPWGSLPVSICAPQSFPDSTIAFTQVCSRTMLVGVKFGPISKKHFGRM